MKPICHCSPYEGTERYAFISYCHQDADMVYPMLDRMGRAGFRLWYDSGIQSGSNWPEVIAEHLQKSEVCVLLLTKASVNSHNCRNEINYAIELGKLILPVVFDGTMLTPGMRLTLGTVQWLKMNSIPTESDIRLLLEATPIRACLGIMDGRIPETPLYQGLPSNRAQAVLPAFDLGIQDSQEKPIKEPEKASEAIQDKPRADEFCQPQILNEKKSTPVEVMPDEADVLTAVQEVTQPPQQESEARSEDNRSEDAQHLDKTVMETPETGNETITGSAGSPDDTVAGEPLYPPVLISLENGQVYYGLPSETVIGRNNLSDLIIPDEEKRIGRKHCKLTSVEGVHVVTDLESKNGTFINGEKLETGEARTVGKTIELGLYTRRFLVVFGKESQEAAKAECIVSLKHDQTGEVRYLWHGKMELGRRNPWEKGALQALNISRQHVEVVLRDGQVILNEISPHGAWLNGQRIEQGTEATLNTGDVFRMGDDSFTVRIVHLKEGSDE